MKISIENNLLSIDNYNQIIDIRSDLIKTSSVEIIGSGMSVRFLDKYEIVVEGCFKEIKLGE